MNNLKNSFSGKIAIATDDQQTITGHIGKCRGFMIYEIAEDKIINKELRENFFTNHVRGERQHNHNEGSFNKHQRLIEGLKDCNFLISKGGGWRLVEDLNQNNISTIFTDDELIETAVDKFIKGELKNESELICNHGHHN